MLDKGGVPSYTIVILPKICAQSPNISKAERQPKKRPWHVGRCCCCGTSLLKEHSSVRNRICRGWASSRGCVSELPQGKTLQGIFVFLFVGCWLRMPFSGVAGVRNRAPTPPPSHPLPTFKRGFDIYRGGTWYLIECEATDCQLLTSHARDNLEASVPVRCRSSSFLDLPQRHKSMRGVGIDQVQKASFEVG